VGEDPPERAAGRGGCAVGEDVAMSAGLEEALCPAEVYAAVFAGAGAGSAWGCLPAQPGQLLGEAACPLSTGEGRDLSG